MTLPPPSRPDPLTRCDMILPPVLQHNPKPRRDYGMTVLFVVLRVLAATAIFAALDTEFWQSILLLGGLQMLIWTMIAEERRR